jgi:hypothetical protein
LILISSSTVYLIARMALSGVASITRSKRLVRFRSISECL